MQGTAVESSGPSSPSASSRMGSPRANRLPKGAPDASTQDACSPCSARAAAHETSKQPLMCVTHEGEQHRDTASQAQLLPASQERAEADCPSKTRQACHEISRMSPAGTADSAERSCMHTGSAAVGAHLDTSAAVSAEHMKDLHSHTADHPPAAARLHHCVLTEQSLNEQNLMPSELASAGEATEQKTAMLSIHLEQHQQSESMQLENRLEKSSAAQSQAQLVSEDAKQSQQSARQQQSSMQARQACSMQPGRTGRQGRPIPRSQARAPLLVRLGLFPGCHLFTSSYRFARVERLISSAAQAIALCCGPEKRCCHEMTQVDESRRLAAAAGVRVMWVAVGARRQGIGSKLLDLARCAAARPDAESCSAAPESPAARPMDKCSGVSAATSLHVCLSWHLPYCALRHRAGATSWRDMWCPGMSWPSRSPQSRDAALQRPTQDPRSFWCTSDVRISRSQSPHAMSDVGAPGAW